MGKRYRNHGDIVRKVFTGCAQVREEKDGSLESMGNCIDKSIVSEAEGGFRVTDFGEEMIEKAEESVKEIKINGTTIKIEK